LLGLFQKEEVYINLTRSAMHFSVKLLHRDLITFEMPNRNKDNKTSVLHLLDAVGEKCKKLRRFIAPYT
jgi:hypothetical protein